MTSSDRVRELLTHGVLEIEGLLVEASNATMRAVATLDGVSARCVYKPVKGERPLWDFPAGTLAAREVAAYEAAAVFGADLVPPTVLRDGPLGPGACQLWIEEEADALVAFRPAGADPAGWHAVAAARDEDGEVYHLAHADDRRLALMAVFDAVINNADRKGAHVLHTGEHVYGVDHGLCFHAEPKLRTVLWGWAAEALPAEAVEALERFAADGPAACAAHLSPPELEALAARAAKLLAEGRFPEPPADRPALPWPPI